MAKPKARGKKCETCNNKGYYTQLYGFNGGRDYEELPSIHWVACPKCNWKNEKKIENVQADIYNAPLTPKKKK